LSNSSDATSNQSPGTGILYACLKYPVTVAVAVLFLLIFSVRSFFAIPIQLTPDVQRPVITVNTVWPGASPAEVEREILQRQEEFLKSLEGLLEMNANANPSSGTITLEFLPGTDLDFALLRVNNALNQVTNYPAESERPILSTGGVRDNAIAWFILIPEDESVMPEISGLKHFIEDTIEASFERVPGVAAANIFGGQEREVHILFDPAKLAARNLTISQVLSALRMEGRDLSAGRIDEGKRRYVVRTMGAYLNIKEIENMVLREELMNRVFLKDIAKVEMGLEEPSERVRYKGIPSVAINAQRRVGSNVLEVMDGLKKAMASLNSNQLKERGLKLVQAYDSTLYIKTSLTLVEQNLILGSLLAIIVLFLFLRNFRPTMIISIAIPISAVGTFLGMYALGRNINVVSLAGISFAVGMLVDNSIVVLESIYTQIQKGSSPRQAAVNGTLEVWGAIFASTTTTVAVFLPLLFMDSEIAQLFKDIALAISCAVSLSLLVSVLVIPTLAAYTLKSKESNDEYAPWTGTVASKITPLFRTTTRIVTLVLVLTVGSIGLSWYISPPAEYLPTGSRNLVFSILIPPPGYNLDEFRRIGKKLEGDFRELWEGEEAPVKSFFFVASGTQVFMGFRTRSSDDVVPLMGKLREKLSTVPGMIAIVIRAGLFNQGFSGGRTIDLRITGPDLQELVNRARQVFFGVLEKLPGSQARPQPGLELGQPELQVFPNHRRLKEVKLSSLELGQTVDAIVDGVKVAEQRLPDGKVVDLVLKGDKGSSMKTQELEKTPIFLPGLGPAPLKTVATIEHQMGPTQILRHEMERAITISVTPSKDIPLETAMNTLKNDILAPMKDQGQFERPYGFKLSGTADKLTTTRKELQSNFLYALVVTYLLLCALFQSFLYPVIILFSVPLASFGGFMALKLVNLGLTKQPLDVLTMLGFIILIGIVVNNAILLLSVTLDQLRNYNASVTEAVFEAIRSRVRPIFMSTLTSLFGMAPLIFMTGPGSELYRGIGSVVLGGLLCSTVFTLILIPALSCLILPLSKEFKSKSLV